MGACGRDTDTEMVFLGECVDEVFCVGKLLGKFNKSLIINWRSYYLTIYLTVEVFSYITHNITPLSPVL